MSKVIVRSALVLFVVAVFTGSLFAQRGEIYPNAGFIWPDTMNNGQSFKTDGIYGIKGGVFLNQNMQLEGSFGYLNHFELRQPPNAFNPMLGTVQPAVRAFSTMSTLLTILESGSFSTSVLARS